MAILKFGPLISGIRGTLGGTIFSANKSGPYARPWAKPVNPQSPAQQTQRQFLASNALEWNALSQGDRDDWDTYAASGPQEKTNSLGEPYFASGFNWYCQINTHLLLSGRARRDVFPTLATPSAPTLLTALVKSPINSDTRAQITHPFHEFFTHDACIFLAFTSFTAPVSKTHGFRGVHFTVETFNESTIFGLQTAFYFGQQHQLQKAFITVFKQTEQGRRSAPSTIATDVII